MSSSTKPLHKPASADEYPASWRWSRLDDICDGIVDCPHSTPTLASVGPLVARSQDIRAGVLDTEAAAHVSEATYRERIVRAEPRQGDLLYSREGTYFGVAAEVPKDTRVCLGQRMVLIRPEPSQVNSRYLKYWLNSPAIVSYIRGFRDGSVAERLNLPTIRGLPVALPSLSEQDRIADALGCLDEKIGLNRRVSRTLVSIARAIFKSWFVDFDPVRRRMTAKTGVELGLSPDLAALFPDSFEPSILGPIPSGWQVSQIGREVDVVGGSTPRTSVVGYWDGGGISFATPRDLAALSSPVLLGTERCVTQEGAETISSGILSPGAVLMSSRAPIGYLAINEIPVCVNQGFIAMRCDGSLPSQHVLHWARSNMDAIVGNANGTTFLEISKRNFRPLPVIVPPIPLLRRFASIAGSLHSCVVATERQTRTLAEVRDAVLPRILSGEVCTTRGDDTASVLLGGSLFG